MSVEHHTNAMTPAPRGENFRGATTSIDHAQIQPIEQVITTATELLLTPGIGPRAEHWAKQVGIIRRAWKNGIINAKTHDEILGLYIASFEHQAERDELTGLQNRNGFIQGFHKAIAHAERTNEPFSVAIIDLDKFKEINDRYLHPNGDKVLKETARRLMPGRSDDLRGRWGGEEFIELFPATDIFSAVEVLERQRVRIEKEVTPAVHEFYGLELGRDITISVGATTFDPREYQEKFGTYDEQIIRIYNGLIAGYQADEHEDMGVVETACRQLAELIRKQEIVNYIVHKADEALYVAKRQGRNRVVAAYDDPFEDDHIYVDTRRTDHLLVKNNRVLDGEPAPTYSRITM